MTPVLEIKSLSLRINGADILSGVDLALNASEVAGLVGRSGSGKSMTALAIMGLAPQQAEISGAVLLNGENLLEKPDRAMDAVRGAHIAMVFQEPMTALNPLQTIGAQVAETIYSHSDAPRAAAMEQAAALLARVGLDPAHVPPTRYPHELSGGQRQRVVIAIAIAMKPAVLIADEPTTALDVTTQAEILALLRQLAAEDGTALLLITHDLAAIAETAARIAVMRQGRIVETYGARAFFSAGSDSAAAELLPAPVDKPASPPPDAAPGLEAPVLGAPVLEARSVSCDYAQARRSMFAQTPRFRAVKEVSLSLRKGEHLAVVGESGSGKSTLARALMGLHPLAGGAVRIGGEAFPQADKTAMRRLRRKIQIVFQDPYSSFNPRQTIRRIIAEPFHLFDTPLTKAEADARVAEALTTVGLAPEDATKRPHEFSGGQRQRIAVARALVIRPEIIILDEATAALDAAARWRVLDLLMRLSQSHGLTYIFITHDLSVVRDVADRVAVMRAGRVIEENTAAEIFAAPQEGYTKDLIAAAPDIEAALSQQAGAR